MSRWSSRSSGQHSFSILVATMALGTLLTPTDLAAQRQAPAAVVAQPGDVVQAWTTGWRYTGTLSRGTRDTVIIRFGGDSALVPISAIQRLDVQRGTRRSIGRVLVGTGVGAALGMVVGALGGYALECGTSCEGEWGGGTGVALGGATGILIGGIAGGVIGGKKRYPRWVAAELR